MLALIDIGDDDFGGIGFEPILDLTQGKGTEATVDVFELDAGRGDFVGARIKKFGGTGEVAVVAVVEVVESSRVGILPVDFDSLAVDGHGKAAHEASDLADGVAVGSHLLVAPGRATLLEEGICVAWIRRSHHAVASPRASAFEDPAATERVLVLDGVEQRRRVGGGRGRGRAVTNGQAAVGRTRALAISDSHATRVSIATGRFRSVGEGNNEDEEE